MHPNKSVDLDYRRLVRDSRRIDVSQHKTQLRVALLSDAATQQFVPVLKTLLHENGVGVVFYEGAFDAIELEAVNPASGLYAFLPDVVVLLQATQALRARYYTFGVEPEFESIPRIWDALAAGFKGRIVQCNFPLPYDRPFGQFDWKVKNSFYRATQELNAHLASEAGKRNGLLLCDMESVASWAGRRAWFDDRLWDMGKTFCALDHLPFAAQAIVDVVMASLGRVVKCIVLDLDNTLWGGVVGDVGPEGIEIAAHGEGEAFYRFQQFLLALKKRGILLAVCSKNDMKNAVAPFEQNQQMVLKREDITVFIANWQNKAANIQAIRDTLEIGFDSMLFLDDSAFERNLVRSFLPEVIVPELPEDPADYVRAICQLNLFETTAYSSEDAERAKLYQQAAQRNQAQSSYADVNEFLQSLDMRITVRRFEADKIGRIAQLFLRSNQFNVTTNRYSEAECVAMMQNPDCVPLQASLCDRFGDQGLISIVVGWPEGDTLRISDWLMSCRVLGRGVEQYLMNHVFCQARELGLAKVSGEYIPTAKNGMVKDFWAGFGFQRVGESKWEQEIWRYEPTTIAWISSVSSHV